MLSIITPAFNEANTISRCIASMISQTYTDFEMIIADDGSSDETVDIAKSFNDPRIRILHSELNGGTSHARNLALRAARGNKVSFLDADDEIEPLYFETLLRCMKNEGADVVGSRVSVIVDGSAFDPYEHYSMPPMLTKIEYMRRYLQLEISPSIWGKVFSRDTIEGIFFPKVRINEDFFYHWECTKRLKRFCTAEDVSYTYHLDQGSANNSRRFSEECLSIIDYACSVVEDVDHSYALLAKEARSHYAACLLHCACMVRDNASKSDPNLVERAKKKLLAASSQSMDRPPNTFLLPELGLSISEVLSEC